MVRRRDFQLCTRCHEKSVVSFVPGSGCSTQSRRSWQGQLLIQIMQKSSWISQVHSLWQVHLSNKLEKTYQAPEELINVKAAFDKNLAVRWKCDPKLNNNVLKIQKNGAVLNITSLINHSEVTCLLPAKAHFSLVHCPLDHAQLILSFAVTPFWLMNLEYGWYCV